MKISEVLKARAETCFLCRMILESQERGVLRDTKECSDGTFCFPVKAQMAHIRIETHGVELDEGAWERFEALQGGAARER